MQGTLLKFYVGVCNLTCLYISQFLSVLNVKESYSARNVINVGQVGGSGSLLSTTLIIFFLLLRFFL